MQVWQPLQTSGIIYKSGKIYKSGIIYKSFYKLWEYLRSMTSYTSPATTLNIPTLFLKTIATYICYDRKSFILGSYRFRRRSNPSNLF